MTRPAHHAGSPGATRPTAVLSHAYPCPNRRPRSIHQGASATAIRSAAEERGAAMTLETAAEYALVLTTTPHQEAAQAPPELGRLSAREQELITLVARGSTDAQIAAQLYISVSTVRSHLDRIRDKTSCRAPRRPHPPGLADRPGLTAQPGSGHTHSRGGTSTGSLALHHATRARDG